MAGRRPFVENPGRKLPHKEKMAARRKEQSLRLPTIRVTISSKYDPRKEDVKHAEERAAAKFIGWPINPHHDKPIRVEG